MGPLCDAAAGATIHRAVPPARLLCARLPPYAGTSERERYALGRDVQLQPVEV
jgi:hypothetical protein